jgi:hypothetical protein
MVTTWTNHCDPATANQSQSHFFTNPFERIFGIFCAYLQELKLSFMLIFKACEIHPKLLFAHHYNDHNVIYI